MKSVTRVTIGAVLLLWMVKLGPKKLGAILLAVVTATFVWQAFQEPGKPSSRWFRAGPSAIVKSHKPWIPKSSSGYGEGRTSSKKTKSVSDGLKTEVIAPKVGITRTTFGSRTAPSNGGVNLVAPSVPSYASRTSRRNSYSPISPGPYGPIGGDGGSGSRDPGDGDGGDNPTPPIPTFPATLSWNGTGMSGDGKYRTVIAANAPVYVSADGGKTWTPAKIDGSASCVDVSYYGTDQIVGTSDGKLYGSHDYGQTWEEYDLPLPGGSSRIRWSSTAISDDGQLIMATDATGYIWQSYDWGDSWDTGGYAGPNWVASDMDYSGTYRTVASDGNWLYTSYNGGATWQVAGENREWADISINYNGQFQTAVVAGGYVYTSIDYGQTWTPQLSDNVREWSAVAMSGDGRRQTAASSKGQLYISEDYGRNWEPVADNRQWSDVSMSVDGRHQTATVNGDYIYVSADFGKTWGAKNPISSPIKPTEGTNLVVTP